MAEHSTVARPYAEALFAAARDGDLGLALWARLVAQMAQLVTNPEVRATMLDPRLDNAERERAFVSLLPGELSPSVRNFIALLVQNQRLLLLPDIAAQFEVLKNRYEGMAQVDITSAFELSEDQVKDLVAALAVKVGLKLKPHVTVDPTLIGGVHMVVGDQVIDASVRAQLTHMREALAA
jgi:F-type H+-transporting ATPase subunit delta